MIKQLALVSAFAACGPATPAPVTAPAPTPASASASEPAPVPAPYAKTEAVSEEAELVAKGGSLVGYPLDRTGGLQPEQFHLASGGKYLYLEAALTSVKKSPANDGPSYLRRGTWKVDGGVLVLEEAERKIYKDGSDVVETTPLTRRLAIGTCSEPVATPCVTLDGTPFYTTDELDPDKEAAGLWGSP